MTNVKHKLVTILISLTLFRLVCRVIAKTSVKINFCGRDNQSVNYSNGLWDGRLLCNFD